MTNIIPMRVKPKTAREKFRYWWSEKFAKKPKKPMATRNNCARGDATAPPEA